MVEPKRPAQSSTTPLPAPEPAKANYCNLCDRQLKSRSGYLSHMRSKMHQRRAEKMADTPLPSQEPTPEPAPVSEDKTPTANFSMDDFKSQFQICLINCMMKKNRKG